MWFYTYKNVEYHSWFECKQHPDFKNVSFPEEMKLTDDLLQSFGITRRQYTPPPPEPPTPEELEAYKKKKIDELEQWRHCSDGTPLAVEGVGTFDFDRWSRAYLRNLYIFLEDGATRNWSLADGTRVEVNKQIIKQLFINAISRSDDSLVKFLDLRNKVKECKTKEEIDAIVWDVPNAPDDSEAE